jgi:hypothetical protein
LVIPQDLKSSPQQQQLLLLLLLLLFVVLGWFMVHFIARNTNKINRLKNCQLCISLATVLGFIQKSTFEKTGFQIPVFPKKPVFEFLQKSN